ncbi:MAG TPA: molybdenum cofactor biosynthesis protein MoaE [Acidobacteriota bacterium]|nr:molybdenum cofactor biosynthesis protein MoaE [Acidobacteriota bacterium]
MIRIQEEPIEPERYLAPLRLQTVGAVVTFEGRTRRFSRGREVDHLLYEAYRPMAEQEIGKLAEEACRRWSLQGLVLVHRVGRVKVGECSVLIAAAAEHRREAFEAVRYLLDTMKRTAPIWKKEVFKDNTNEAVWVESSDNPHGQ